jgi:hypothetical protein
VGRTIVAFCIVAALALTVVSLYYTRRANALLSRVDVYDAFETRKLSDLWSTDRFARGAVTMQSEFVRAGRGAAKVVVHSQDKFEAGINGNKDTERAELLEAEKLVSKEDTTYEYSFSMLIPADFPIVPTRLVIAQWKQDCSGHPNCSDDSPVIAIRYVSGQLTITHQIGLHRTILFETGESLRGKWTDFRFRIRFSSHGRGLLQAWINGKQVVDYRGVNAYPENATTGYRNPSLFYFKMGLYRDVMAEPMTIYIDEYRKRQVPSAGV